MTPNVSLSKCDILSSHSVVDKDVGYCVTPLRLVHNYRRFGGAIYVVLSFIIQKPTSIILISNLTEIGVFIIVISRICVIRHSEALIQSL